MTGCNYIPYIASNVVPIQTNIHIYIYVYTLHPNMYTHRSPICQGANQSPVSPALMHSRTTHSSATRGWENINNSVGYDISESTMNGCLSKNDNHYMNVDLHILKILDIWIIFINNPFPRYPPSICYSICRRGTLE